MRIIAALLLLAPTPALAAEASGGMNLGLTSAPIGLFAVVIFVVAYLVVMTEEFTHIRKSKPVLIGGAAIWVLLAVAAGEVGAERHALQDAFRHTFLEFAELFFFLLVAITYINAMTERNVFEWLRAWLVSRGFGLRKVFWITGIIAFFLSPIADNLTTALVMCAVVMAVGKGQPRFVALAATNIVVAANAGGAFSPFGDITTLMVWQKGVLSFWDFFAIFVPSAVSFLIPAAVMHFAVPNQQPTVASDTVQLRTGALMIVGLFLATICFTVSSHQLFHVPPAFGMLAGFGVLCWFSLLLRRHDARQERDDDDIFDIFQTVGRGEWDTLFFFYGVLMCVGGLANFGYLALSTEVVYGGLGNTWANSLVGVLSAIVDNIPVMFAVLTAFPSMDEGQWLLVTYAAGVGGSMISIGSAAGVALMGQARGVYTFFSHLRWTPVIAVGYAVGIWVHLMWNESLFDNVPLVLP
jgi:Na+/H+ antiporter NhaD/arsenite permease-like protein